MLGGNSLFAHTMEVRRGGEREMEGASHLGKTVGWGRSPEWADWVHVNNFVNRCLDSGFEVARGNIVIFWCW